MYSMVHYDIYGFHELVNKTHTEVVGSETPGNEKLNPFDQRKTASEWITIGLDLFLMHKLDLDVAIELPNSSFVHANFILSTNALIVCVWRNMWKHNIHKELTLP